MEPHNGINFHLNEPRSGVPCWISLTPEPTAIQIQRRTTTMVKESYVDVLVLGAGPAGLMTSNDLAKMEHMLASWIRERRESLPDKRTMSSHSWLECSSENSQPKFYISEIIERQISSRLQLDVYGQLFIKEQLGPVFLDLMHVTDSKLIDSLCKYKSTVMTEKTFFGKFEALWNQRG